MTRFSRTRTTLRTWSKNRVRMHLAIIGVLLMIVGATGMFRDPQFIPLVQALGVGPWGFVCGVQFFVGMIAFMGSLKPRFQNQGHIALIVMSTFLSALYGITALVAGGAALYIASATFMWIAHTESCFLVAEASDPTPPSCPSPDTING